MYLEIHLVDAMTKTLLKIWVFNLVDTFEKINKITIKKCINNNKKKIKLKKRRYKNGIENAKILQIDHKNTFTCS